MTPEERKEYNKNYYSSKKMKSLVKLVRKYNVKYVKDLLSETI